MTTTYKTYLEKNARKAQKVKLAEARFKARLLGGRVKRIKIGDQVCYTVVC